MKSYAILIGIIEQSRRNMANESPVDGGKWFGGGVTH